jgi:hypothetical protein
MLLVNVSPFGNAPDSLKVGVGAPDATNVQVPATPTMKGFVLLELESVAAEVAGAVGVDPPPAPHPASAHPSNPQRNRRLSVRARRTVRPALEAGTHGRPEIVCAYIHGAKHWQGRAVKIYRSEGAFEGPTEAVNRAEFLSYRVEASLFNSRVNPAIYNSKN